MGRNYVVTFEQVAVSAVQDLLQIKGAAGKMLRIKRVWWGSTDTAIPTSQMISTRCRYLPAAVTDGSGGSSPTPAAFDPGTGAASFTAKANNTTKATSSGTAITMEESGDHIYNGYSRAFADPPAVGPSESFVFELLSTVSGTVHLSGGAEVEELGG